MAVRVGKREIGSWKKKYERARARLRKAGDKADTVVETLVHTAEVGSAAFVLGVVQGRTGGVQVLGVPIDLGLAATLHTLAFMGVGGKMSSHLHGFADGALASYLTTTGRGLGREMVKEKKKAGTSGHLPGASSHELGPSAGAYLTEEDMRLAEMARAI